MNDLATIINSVGFPIVACGGVAWFCKYLIDNMTKTIEENTKVIQQLIVKLGDDDD